MAGASSGTIWRCGFDRQGPEDTAVPYAPACPAGSGTTFLQYGLGADGHTSLALLGSADGLVRIQPSPSGPGGAPEGKAWQASLHDMLDGRVTSVALSFDGAFLLTASMDGTMYVQQVGAELAGPAAGPSPSASEDNLLPATPAEAVPPVPPVDITNPSEYTLEEAKQKAELDALLAQVCGGGDTGCWWLLRLGL